MKIYQVDAFTQTRFKGNPAAVIILDEWLDAHLMQQIARNGFFKKNYSRSLSNSLV